MVAAVQHGQILRGRGDVAEGRKVPVEKVRELVDLVNQDPRRGIIRLQVVEGKIDKGQPAKLEVEHKRRGAIRANLK